jgi:hypothetical protein
LITTISFEIRNELEKKNNNSLDFSVFLEKEKRTQLTVYGGCSRGRGAS